MKIKERIAKFLFPDVIEEEIQKSSKQVVSHVLGLSSSEGILPEVNLEIYNQMYEQTSWVRAVVGVICKAVTARGYSLIPTRPNPDQKNAEMLAEFFANCNPNDTFLEILDDITRDEYVFGNAFFGGRSRRGREAKRALEFGCHDGSRESGRTWLDPGLRPDAQIFVVLSKRAGGF
jgi:hypothetical protein